MQALPCQALVQALDKQCLAMFSHTFINTGHNLISGRFWGKINVPSIFEGDRLKVARSPGERGRQVDSVMRKKTKSMFVEVLRACRRRVPAG